MHLGPLLAAGSLLIRSSATNYVRDTAQTNSSACADLASTVRASNKTVVPARVLYECFVSVPINKTAATRFVKTFNETVLQFQSTTAFLKNPPPSYQQPAVDLNAGLNAIQDMITNGTYTNEFDFESDLQSLVLSAHDGHFDIRTGLVGQTFGFAVPGFQLVSLSSDGQEEPKVYVISDVLQAGNSSGSSWEPSALKTINGQDAVSYMESFAANFTDGGIDGDTDWNKLIQIPSIFEISQSGSTFATSNLWPGEWLNVTFANGSTLSLSYVGEIVDRTQLPVIAQIQTAQDFYDAFVSPQESSDSSDNSSTTTTATASGTTAATATASPTASSKALSKWPYVAFPDPFVVQDDLGVVFPASEPETPSLTGYLIDDDNLAVLSVPSFSFTGARAQSFSAVIGEFITGAKKAGAKKVVIDVQGNGGGTFALATEIFKNFFPNTAPFSGNRIRVFDTVDVLGRGTTAMFELVEAVNALTGTAEEEVESLAGSPFVATSFVSAVTGQLFKSWDQLATPYTDNGDQFSQTILEDFSDQLQDLGLTMDDTGEGIIIDGFGNRTNSSAQQPWAAEDIVILTDGVCASTCHTFAELFTQIAGVRTVAIGGRPSTGPMQAKGGVRGGNVLDALDAVIPKIQELDTLYPAELSALPDVSDTGITIQSARFNYKDSVRMNETFPLQFAYEAANCRLFYTLQNFNNFTQLWTETANAIWSNSSICVSGSTNQTSAGKTTDTCGPTAKNCKPYDVSVNTNFNSSSGKAAGSGPNNSSSSSSTGSGMGGQTGVSAAPARLGTSLGSASVFALTVLFAVVSLS